MNTELAIVNQSRAEEANARHQEVTQFVKAMQNGTVRSANAMRECGQFLIDIKRDTPHGEWLNLFATAEGQANRTGVFDFDAITGRRYMQFARANPEPFETIEQAAGAYREIYKTAGLIGPGKTTNEAGRVTPIDSWMTGVLDAVSSINRIVDKHDISTAPTPIKEAFVERVRPVVRLFFSAGGQM